MTTPASIHRRLLLGAAISVPLAAPGIARAQANGEVIVRTPGGAYDDIMRRFVYDPFTAETGIRVTVVAATAAKLIAMFRANNVELDLIDTGDAQLLTLERLGALAPIAYDRWRWSKPEDITPRSGCPIASATSPMPPCSPTTRRPSRATTIPRAGPSSGTPGSSPARACWPTWRAAPPISNSRCSPTACRRTSSTPSTWIARCAP
jgi:hypothetical protein